MYDTADDGTPLVRLSSRWTYLQRRVFPIIWYGFLALFLGVSLVIRAKRKPGDELIPIWLFPLAVAVFGFFGMKHFVFGLADEVWDAGSDLIVKNHGIERRVELKDIIDAKYTALLRRSRETLTLAEPPDGANVVTFRPPFKFFPHTMPRIVMDLFLRIEAARNSSRG
jgi:hypothetical protein